MRAKYTIKDTLIYDTPWGEKKRVEEIPFKVEINDFEVYYYFHTPQHGYGSSYVVSQEDIIGKLTWYKKLLRKLWK